MGDDESGNDRPISLGQTPAGIDGVGDRARQSGLRFPVSADPIGVTRMMEADWTPDSGEVEAWDLRTPFGDYLRAGAQGFYAIQPPPTTISPS